jgi:conjugal transfer pilus assembly protein TraW
MRNINWSPFVELFFLILSLSNLTLFASDFGSQGQTFPVQERGFFESIEENLKKKTLTEDQKQKVRALIVNKAKNPTAVKFLTEAVKYRKFIFDPTAYAKEDYRDLNGDIVVSKGTKSNPLDTINLPSGLLFIDGNNSDHLRWAHAQRGEFKWVLVRGSPIKVEENEKRPIYFDQGGAYSKIFGLKHVPCRVQQEGNILVVEEIPIKLSKSQEGL